MVPKRFASLVPFFVVVVMAALWLIPLGVVNAATCNVPTLSYYPTIQSAVDDWSCDTINLTNPPGSPYFEHVTIYYFRIVTIQGQGSGNTVIDGSATGTVFTILPSTNVTFADLTIQNGAISPGNGGGINNQGTVTVMNSTIKFSATYDRGGGIYNVGTLTLNNSTLSDNYAHQGSGIYNDGNLTLNNSTLSENRWGGGIYNDGNLTINNSTLSDNSALIQGGGISNHGMLMVTDSTLSGNVAGFAAGGILNDGMLTVTNSTLSGNVAGFAAGDPYAFGGGILNHGSATVTNSTLSGNSAINGGAIANSGGTLTIINSTLSTNSAINGGAIDNTGTITIINSTLSTNSADFGGGISSSFSGFGTVRMTNSIIANSLNGGNCNLFITSLGHNISSDGSCNLRGPGDMNNTDPLLGPLQDNRGPTFTHWPQGGRSPSPAIDAGDDAACPAADQRDVKRPLDGNGDGVFTCDIGSVEQ